MLTTEFERLLNGDLHPVCLDDGPVTLDTSKQPLKYSGVYNTKINGAKSANDLIRAAGTTRLDVGDYAVNGATVTKLS